MNKIFSRSFLRSGLIFFILIFIIALVIRITWAILASSVDPFLRKDPLLGDAASYYRIAINLLNGNGYAQYAQRPSSFWPPLYTYSMFAVFAMIGKNLTAMRIIQAFWGSIPPVIFSWIALKNYNKAIAIIVGVGLAAYPFLIYFGAWLIAEPLFLKLFSITMLCAALYALKKNYLWLISMGIFLGLSILTKPSALFFTPFLLVWIFFAQKDLSLIKRILYISAFVLPTLLIVLPWTIRNFIVFDRLVLVSSNSGYTLLGANNPNAWGGHDEGFPALIPNLNEAEMDQVFYTQAMKWIQTHPLDFIKLGIIKIQRLLSPLSVASQRQDFVVPGSKLIYLGYSAFLLFSLAGMIIGVKNFRRIGYLYAPIVGVFLSAFIFYGDARYTIPMIPSLVIFSAIAIVIGYKWAKQQIRIIQ